MSKALNTIAAIVSSGRTDLETMPWAALRYQHTAAVRSALIEKYKPSTANKMLAALRGVLKESWRLGYMTAEDYHRAADVPTIKAQTPPRGRALASGEISALMNTCGRDSSPAGIRDAALIAVLYGAGLRRSESVGLDLCDYKIETGELAIRGAKRTKRSARLRPQRVPHGHRKLTKYRKAAEVGRVAYRDGSQFVGNGRNLYIPAHPRAHFGAWDGSRSQPGTNQIPMMGIFWPLFATWLDGWFALSPQEEPLSVMDLENRVSRRR